MGGFGGGPGGGMQPPGQGKQQGTQQGGGMGRPPTGGQGGQPPTGSRQGQGRTGTSQQGRQQGQQPGAMPGTGEGFRGGGGGGGGGAMGGLLNGASVDTAAKKLVAKNADDYTWSAAAIGSQNAASYQLATGDPVMAIGGFNGSDPSPTLSQFKKYVEDGRIHYFISSGEGGGGGMGGNSGTSSKISTWVEANFKKVTAGSATFYDLTRPI
ncbi:hypothetical protein [Streptomyces laculatispora]|uniref:hypothetical protein n=1 Tax=Streptomyces laculatispora TaxID=887464 RepID=UPI003F7F199C